MSRMSRSAKPPRFHTQTHRRPFAPPKKKRILVWFLSTSYRIVVCEESCLPNGIPIRTPETRGNTIICLNKVLFGIALAPVGSVHPAAMDKARP